MPILAPHPPLAPDVPGLLPAPLTDLIFAIGIPAFWIVLAGAALWALLVAADFLVLPHFPRAGWKRPWCALQGHIDDDFHHDDTGAAFDICTRCGRWTPSTDPEG
ncbi:MAG: hypothetical protein Q8L23_15750 [Caulobacter sp.]|nr:hypothetical protein [Caulobacter sp.]